MFVPVVASNIGLALQRSYPGLFVLRMVQSAAASGELPRVPLLMILETIKVGSGRNDTDGNTGSYGAAYGIVADITTVAKRGSYIGSLSENGRLPG